MGDYILENASFLTPGACNAGGNHYYALFTNALIMHKQQRVNLSSGAQSRILV